MKQLVIFPAEMAVGIISQVGKAKGLPVSDIVTAVLRSTVQEFMASGVYLAGDMQSPAVQRIIANIKPAEPTPTLPPVVAPSPALISQPAHRVAVVPDPQSLAAPAESQPADI